MTALVCIRLAEQVKRKKMQTLFSSWHHQELNWLVMEVTWLNKILPMESWKPKRERSANRSKKMKLMTERVIIIGSDLAGLELAKKLSGNKHFEVIIVNRNNYHFFPPLMR